MFTFQSPQGSGRSSPNGATAAAVVSPGQFGLGQGIGTGVGMGLDDMLHEKYSLSPIGKESQRLLMSPRKSVRFISKTPFKVLDAPDLAVRVSLWFYIRIELMWTSIFVLTGRLLPQSCILVEQQRSCRRALCLRVPLVRAY